MSVLVTGAGLVGAQVARLLAEQGREPVLLDARPHRDAIADVLGSAEVPLIEADVRDERAIAAAIADSGAREVVHTVGLMAPQLREDPLLGATVNVAGTATVLDAARRAGVERVVVASSGTVAFGVVRREGHADGEDFAARSFSERPPGMYSASKAAAEQIAWAFRDDHGLDVRIVRYTAVFGPWAGAENSFAGRLMSRLAGGGAAGEGCTIDDPLLTWSGVVDFVYSKDAAEGTVRALDAADPASRLYNLSMGEAYTFEQVLDAARRAFPEARFGATATNERGPSGSPFTYARPYPIEAAERELGYRPRFLLDDALRDYGEWLQARRAVVTH